MGKWPCYRQKSNQRTENVFSRRNVISGIPPGSVLESVLLVSDLEEIANGDIVQFGALRIECHSVDEQLHKGMKNPVRGQNGDK